MNPEEPPIAPDHESGALFGSSSILISVGLIGQNCNPMTVKSEECSLYSHENSKPLNSDNFSFIAAVPKLMSESWPSAVMKIFPHSRPARITNPLNPRVRPLCRRVKVTGPHQKHRAAGGCRWRPIIPAPARRILLVLCWRMATMALGLGRGRQFVAHCGHLCPIVPQTC